MFNVLSYLFNNYQSFELCMDNNEILEKLSAAGFNDNDISSAIDWLEGLDNMEQYEASFVEYAAHDCIRVLTPQEEELLDTAGKEFLWSLWYKKVIDHKEFEWIITQVQSIDQQPFGINELKVVILMLLWRYGLLQQASTLRSLVVEENSLSLVH